MHTRSALTLDTLKNTSFAQHPGGFDCELMFSVQMLFFFFFFFFFKTNVSRLDLKDRLGSSLRGLGTEFQVTGPIHEKARFPYLLNLIRGAIMRPAVYDWGAQDLFIYTRTIVNISAFVDSQKHRHSGLSSLTLSPVSSSSSSFSSSDRV